MKPSTTPSSIETHRQAFERALRQALSTSQPALRQKALGEASRHLIHPRLILESSLLADNHPWRLQALAVSDAFEAVTNGMEVAEVFEALEGWEPDSLLEPWRELILAVRDFHEGQDSHALRRAEVIPPASPASELARVVLALSGRPSRLSRSQTALAEQIARPDPLTEQWIQDVTEGLETDDEGLFWGAFADWLDLASDRAPGPARAAVLWAWGQLEWRDFDEGVLLDLAALHWGRSEAYRLAALGTAGWDPEGASLLWLRFLIAASREDCLSRGQLAEARSLLEPFEKAAGTLTPEAAGVRASLAAAWNAETALRGWPEGRIAVAAQKTAPMGQLDLFA